MGCRGAGFHSRTDLGPHGRGHRLEAGGASVSTRAALLHGCISIANNDGVSVFPDSLSPLMMAVLNVNYPQTRKSAKNSSSREPGARNGQARVQESTHCKGPGEMAKSSVLAKFTEEASWERCAPHFQQVHALEPPRPGGRAGPRTL